MRTVKSKPTLEERIKSRAHEIWEQNGRPDGQHLEHWRQAEVELTATTKKPRAAAKAAKAAPKAKTAPKAAKPKAAPKAKPAAVAGAARRATPAATPKRQKAAAD